MSRRSWLVLAGLVALELALVMGTFVSAPHPGGDNAGYVALADGLRDGAGYTEVWDPAAPPHTKYPPVFPALLSLALLLGASTWAGLKVVPVLFALVTVAGVFLWARGRVGDWAGAGIALLTGASAGVIYHAHWLLSDVPFLALTALALWSLDRLLDSDSASGIDPAGEDDGGEGSVNEKVAGASLLSLSIAAGLVVLTLFTRTAGLPLAGAAVLSLLLRRRIRDAVVMAVALGLPGILWVLRGRASGPGEGRYGSEFFLLDPYQPDLGSASAGDFVVRVMDNLGGYLGRFLPDALFGSSGGFLTVLAVGVTGLALAGWVTRLRVRVGAVEIFFPAYAGLILLWPQVWSGDRFALPLVPVLLLMAFHGVQLVARVASSRGTGTAAARLELPMVAVLGGVLLVAQGQGWMTSRQEAAACRGAARAVGPWACGGGGLLDLVVTARWAGENLPAGSAVLTRKPRIWYAMSGVPTRTYPFTAEPGVLLDDAQQAGADFVLLDFVGSQGVDFIGAALADTPERFCQVGAFGGDGSIPASRLLRILPPGQPSGTRVANGQLALESCPSAPSGVTVGREGEAGPDAWRIPVLETATRTGG